MTEIIEPIEQPITEETAVEESNNHQQVRKWAGRLAGGALVAGGIAAYATNPIGHISAEEVKDAAVESAPYAAAVGVSETLWIGGAAISLAAAGKRVKIKGIKSNFRESASEFAEDVYSSSAFKYGLRANTIGAIGTAATIGVAAVTKMPPETWPGALGLVGLDMAGTMALRAPLYKGVKERAKTAETDAKISVRTARLEDMDRLADIDLASFGSSYGEDLPQKEEVIDMLTKRWHNAPGWMFVAEKDGQVEGFVTAFRTDKPADEFVSWEDSTANGTLEGKVNPRGKYAYVANLTVNREAEVKGAKDMLLANLFANAIAEGGVEYGYFESRMPGFAEWLDSEGLTGLSTEELTATAQRYAETRREDGKRIDWQLRMYEGDGFKLGAPRAGAFDDDASMNFGVVCTADVPGNNKFMNAFPPARKALAGALRLAAKSPKILRKVL